MRLASYNLRGRPSFGAVVGEGVVDLRARLGRFATLLDVFRAQALDQAKAAAEDVRPDVPLEFAKAIIQRQVIVEGQFLGMRVQGESAERSSQPQQFRKQLGRVRAGRGEHMTQRPQTGIDGVQKPEAAHLLRRESGAEFAPLAALQRYRGALLLENFDQAPRHPHQGLTSADLQAGRDEGFIVDVVPRSIPLHPRDRQGLHLSRIFGIEEKLKVLAAHFQHLLIQAGILIREGLFFRDISCAPGLLIVRKSAVR